MGSTGRLPEYNSLNDTLVLDDNLEADEDRETDDSSEIIYMASFDELARNYLQYETIIWLSISLLLVLAWGIGVIMLLYLPFKRYVLMKDISSRKLYVTPTEIVYKASRPSFLPFWKTVTMERHIPLSLVINVIIEQGCLQSVYGIQTFRVESIARGKAALVDELQVQGVSNPGHLRKVIIAEASKVFLNAEKTINHVSSLNERLGSSRLSSKKWKAENSVHHAEFTEHRETASRELILHKLDEMDKSVQEIESLIDKSQPSSKLAE
ncbi:unnamed protein product [Amaranthus hypochondriacus]